MKIKLASNTKILIFWQIVVCVLIALPFKVNAASSQIRITEIMYDPSGNGDKEFLEIYNGSDTSAVVGGMTLFGVDYTFPAGSILAAGQYGVIVRNLTVFKAVNPGVKIFGQYGGKLRGSGELISVSSSGVVQTSVSYRYGGDWPSSPKNGGPSLSLLRSNADEKSAACWAISATQGGTPGRANNPTGSGGTGCGNIAYPITVSSSTNSSSSAQKSGSQPETTSSETNTATTNTQQNNANQGASSNQTINEAEQKKEQDELSNQAVAEAKAAEQASKQIADEAFARRQKTKTNSSIALVIVCLVGLFAIGYYVYIKINNHLISKRLNRKPKKKNAKKN